MRRPGDNEPEPEGGRSRARLEQFLASHFGSDPSAAAGAPEEPAPEEPEGTAAAAPADPAQPPDDPA